MNKKAVLSNLVITANDPFVKYVNKLYDWPD